MTRQTDHLRMVGVWLNDLASLTAGTAPLADAKAKIAALAGVLSQDFPMPEAFCKASLYTISKQFTFFPSYGPLGKALERWWGENRPKSEFIPNDPGLTPQERALVLTWHRDKEADFAHLMDKGDLRARMALSLGILRKYRGAFAYICRTDLDAASIVVERQWQLDLPRTGPRLDEEIAACEAASRAAVQGIADALRPPRPLMSHRVEPETLPARQPATLPKERLDAIREANPTVARARALARERIPQGGSPSNALQGGDERATGNIRGETAPPPARTPDDPAPAQGGGPWRAPWNEAAA